VATVNELSGGRVVVTMLAGGSMVLKPMGIERHRPFTVLAEAVEVMRLLWSGEVVTWHGETCALDKAKLGLGPQDIPLWIAGRGPKVLGLAGRSADGVILTVKPDLGAALSIVDGAATAAGRDHPQRMYLGRVCYTPDLFEGQRRTLSYVLMDSPRRVLSSLGLSDIEVRTVEEGARTNESSLVDPIVSDELLRRYQVAGTPEQCSSQIRALVTEHGLNTMLIDVLSSDLEENLAVMRDTLPIIKGSTE
jgi:alkanesulfonate monooxygenase SsuD/methylene tetrahydromethanopterin reductase-like flavin-dependent oxidoreductase (luciferase family)